MKPRKFTLVQIRELKVDFAPGPMFLRRDGGVLRPDDRCASTAGESRA